MNKNNIYLLYDKPNEVSAAWDDKFCKLINEHDWEGLRKHVHNAKYLLHDEYLVKSYIAHRFASNVSKEALDGAFHLMSEINGLEIKSNTEECVSVVHRDFSLEARRLTSEYPEMKNFDPELESFEERRGKCHDKAFNYALAFKGDAEIVTGYIHGYSDISSYSHSWVELKDEGQELVIESASNAVMNKDGYYAIEQIEPISRISWKESYIEMMTICELGLNADLGMKDYVIFREQLLRDLKKHRRFNELLAKNKEKLDAKLER